MDNQLILISSAESGGSPSPRAKQDSEPSGSVKSTDTASESSPKISEPKLWATPSVPNGGRSLPEEDVLAKGKTPRGKRQVNLSNQAKLWPTPRAGNVSSTRTENGNPQKDGLSLNQAVKTMWRSPTATEAGARVETLYTKDGRPAQVGERAYRKTPDGRLVLQTQTLGQQVQYIPISSNSMEPNSEESRYSQGDFLANLTQLPGSEGARKMTVTCGLKCSELLRKPDQISSLVKMFLVSSRWNSSICFLKWNPMGVLKGSSEQWSIVWDEELQMKRWKLLNRSVTMSHRCVFQLVPSMPSTAGCDSSFSQDEEIQEMWPTVRASEWKGTGPVGSKSHTHMLERKYLCAEVAQAEQEMLPTPQAMDAMGARSPEAVDHLMQGQRKGRTKLSTLKDVVVHGLHYFPTPKGTASGPDYARMNRPNSGGDDLVTAVARGLLPTPTAPGSHQVGVIGEWGGSGNPLRNEETMTIAGGALNPVWVEWLMGYPLGWTDCEDSETRSSRPS